MFKRRIDMSYLTPPLFLGNYDSLVEQCFDYAFEREDECLFEQMVLQELSQDKKLRAARRAAFLGMNKNGISDSIRINKDILNNAKNMSPDEDDNAFMGKNWNLRLAQSGLSRTGKVLAGKRKRLLKYLENTPEGTKFKSFSDNKEADTIVDSSLKKSIEKIYKGMSDENIHKEYNELRKEIEELNKDNPKIKKNQDRLFKTAVQQSAPVNNKLVLIQTSSDNKKENQKEETGSKKEQEQTQNTENTKEMVNNNFKSENSDKASRIAKIKSRIKGIIDSLKKKYDEIKKNINNTPPEKRTLLQKFMHKIIQMIDKFKGLLNK
jgi:hypothetical protein